MAKTRSHGATLTPPVCAAGHGCSIASIALVTFVHETSRARSTRALATDSGRIKRQYRTTRP
eukprot:3486853-Prymnesium_polylepis.1